MNSWLGLVDVTTRSQFRAAGLSMVVSPERRMSACLPSGKGLWVGRRDARVGVEVVDDRRLDVLVRCFVKPSLSLEVPAPRRRPRHASDALALRLNVTF